MIMERKIADESSWNEEKTYKSYNKHYTKHGGS